LLVIWCMPWIEYSAVMYSGMVNSSTSTAAWAIACSAALSVALCAGSRGALALALTVRRLLIPFTSFPPVV
jgi:hypothetical protein